MTVLRLMYRIGLALLVLAVALSGGDSYYTAWQVGTWDDEED